MSAHYQCRSLNITVAAYNQGALLLADTPSEGRSRVILVSRDLTIPPVGGGSHPGLRELVCEVSPPVPGKYTLSSQQPIIRQQYTFQVMRPCNTSEMCHAAV